MSMSQPARDFSIRQSIWIAAEPARVYRALTSSEDLARWFCREASVDTKVGGQVRFEFGHGKEEGVFLELEQDRKTVFTFGNDKVTYVLEVHNGGTRVTLINENLPRDLDIVAGTSEGWASYLCNLKCLLEHGWDLRADQPQGSILNC